MKIRDVEIFHLSVPYIPIIQKYQPQELHPTIVRIYTDEGVDGVGGGSHELQWKPSRSLMKEFSKLKGKNPLEINPRLIPYPFNVALYDMVGKILKVPVSYLLGGRVRDKVPLAYWTHAMATPEETASEAIVAVQKGYRVYKWHTNPRADTIVKRVEAIDNAVGDKLSIRIDMKFQEKVPWRFGTTARIAKQIEGYSIECLEDPLPGPRDPDLHCLLKKEVSIPLAWHTGDPEEVLRAAKYNACDYINIDRCRDVNRGLKAAAVAEVADMPVWTAAPGGSTGVQYIFGLHLASTIENATLPADTGFLLEEDFVKEPLPPVIDGVSRVPDEPGLGIEIDEKTLKEYAVKKSL